MALKFSKIPRTRYLKWAFAFYAVTTLISMAAMSIGAAVLFVTILLNLTEAGDSIDFRAPPAIRWYGILSLLLALAGAWSLAIGSWFPLSYGGSGVQIHFFKDMAKAWYLFWPLLLWMGLKKLDQRDREHILHSWLWAFAALSALGLVQYLTGWPRPQPIPGEPGHYHVTLFLGHHLSLASIWIFPFFAALDLAHSHRNIQGVKYGLTAGLGLAALILTYSRTLWVALAVGILARTLWIFWKDSRRLLWAAVISIGVGTFLISQYPPFHQRLHQNIGIGERQDLWLANWEFFKQRPLSGVGWRHNHELSGAYLIEKYHRPDVFSGHAHNNFLDMLGGTGIGGALAWLAWSFWVIRILIRRKSSQGIDLRMDMAHGWICAWLVFHINGLTQVNFWEGKVQHQMAWVIAWSLLRLSDLGEVQGGIRT